MNKAMNKASSYTSMNLPILARLGKKFICSVLYSVLYDLQLQQCGRDIMQYCSMVC